MADGVVIIGDHTITIDDVAALARRHQPAALSRGARERMAAARAVVERHVGEAMPAEEVRAMMAARAAAMAVGQTGVSPAVAEALVAALNAGFHPVVPSIGSIGAADLAPLAHMALALLGEGEADFAGERLA